ncbi:RNA polymerase sigma factor [Vallitalea longa]|uniref:RNA polymerase sigma factor n=1 Tax=Vallitalea longa TaxID=2936439 RepID=A0A9W5YDS5_9FIRM|nr:RNA polymerase sigma factor [Vallitalea longa]GKX32245.1 RNA polymerase sigma factor [Vallitalea longa]
MQTDEKLIKNIISGDEEALNLLVKKYYNLVYGFVYRKMGDYHKSYDITQEIFIKVIKSIKKYKHKKNFINWLLKIAVNHCNDYYRSSKNKEDVSIDNFYDITSSSNPYEEVLNKTDSEIIRKLVLSLPDYQRDVIILRFYNDLKFKEIAFITKSSESTAKSRYRQGINRLKLLIKEEEHFE